MSYQLTHQQWHGAGEEPESGHVCADICDDIGGRVESHVGNVHIVIARMAEISDPFELLHRESADPDHIAATLSDIGTGGLDENSTRSPARVRAVPAILA